MRVFLTGGSGFIGQALLRRLLDRGDHVHLLLREGRPLLGVSPIHHANMTIFRGGLHDQVLLCQGMRGCDLVFHLAAHVGLTSGESALFEETNVDGTRNVIDAALAEGVKKVVYTSTVMTIGPTEGFIANEETSRQSDYLSDYERTKAMAEAEVKSAAQRGLPVVIVSPAFVYGPGRRSRSSLNRFLHEGMSRGYALIPGGGGQKINMVYVDDVVEGHLLAASHATIGEKYILGGENVTIHDLALKLKRLVPRRLTLLHLPWPLIHGVSRMAWLISLFQGGVCRMPPQFVTMIQQDWAYSSKKAIDGLGYRLTPLNQGLSLMLQEFCKNKGGDKD